MTKLQIYEGQDKIGEVQLGGEPLSLGRDLANDVVLPDVSVSRRHAQIEPTGNFFLIRDKGSTNGTFVNDMLVHLKLLSDGDVIRAGKYLLRVEARRPTVKTHTQVRVEKASFPEPPFPGDDQSTTVDDDEEDGEKTVSINVNTLGTALSPGLDFLLRLKELHTEIGYVHGENELLDHSLEIILAELEADRGAFLLSQPRQASRGSTSPSELRAAAALCHLSNVQPVNEIVIADTHLAAVLDCRRTLIYSLPGDEPPGTAMVAPLADRAGIQGVVYVDRPHSEKPFNDSDRLLLTAIADQVTISLANARLFEEMYAEREKVQAIFTSLTDGVLVTDTSFLVSDANNAATILLGTYHCNPIGQPLFNLLRSFHISPDLQVVADEASSEGAVFHLTSRKTDRQIVESNLDGRIVPYPRGDGTRKGFVVTLRDATQSRQMEQLKSEFIGNVAHKLRTPLTVIEANLPLLAADPEPKDVDREILDELERNSHRLCHLVDQFVQFAEMELRSAEAAESPTLSTIKSIVTEAIRRKAPRALEKGIKLEERVRADLPPLRVRVSRLTDALERIIDNSLKFSDQGSKVVVEGEVAGGALRLHFVDDGPGIPPQEIESVFYVGHQVDEQHTGQVPGAGLGLTIARHIVKEHGGEVRITSPYRFPDRGTRVSVVLPLKLGGPASRSVTHSKSMDYADYTSHPA